MGFNTATNATAAKIIGAGTIAVALLLSSEWGIASAAVLTAAGSVLVVGAGDELPRLSIRNLVLFVGYWGLLLFGIGLGV